MHHSSLAVCGYNEMASLEAMIDCGRLSVVFTTGKALPLRNAVMRIMYGHSDHASLLCVRDLVVYTDGADSPAPNLFLRGAEASRALITSLLVSRDIRYARLSRRWSPEQSTLYSNGAIRIGRLRAE